MSVQFEKPISFLNFQFNFYMQDFTVSVRKITDIELMREACEMTFMGTSKQSLLSIYKSEHSPARTQLFWITAKSIPLFIATHLIRHHVGSTPFQLTCRDDRNGGNPNLKVRVDSIVSNLKADLSKVNDVIEELEWIKDNSDRYTPVNLGLFINAQSLIDIAKLRLCVGQAHKETIQVFNVIKDKVAEVDPDLANLMVVKCVYRGGICGEPKCCGYNSTKKFKEEMQNYISHYSTKQRGGFINGN